MTTRKIGWAFGCALVTGGGTGIGRGIALALARRGAPVVLIGRRLKPLHAVAAEVHACGGRAAVVVGDIADPAARPHLLDAARLPFGPIHLLVNNAGVFASGSLLQVNGPEIERTVATNLTAPIDLTRLALPDLMLTQGAVIYVGSTLSHAPLPYASLYSASKAGLHAFCTSLRPELAALGVHLLAAYPPTVETAMTDGMARNAGRWQGGRQQPEAAGERIVAALAAGAAEVQWGAGERLLLMLNRLAPHLVARSLATQRRRLAHIMTPAPAAADAPSSSPGSLSHQLDALRAALPLQACTIAGHTWRFLDTRGAGDVLLLLPGALGEADTSFEYILALQDSWRVLSLNYPSSLHTLPGALEGLTGLLNHLDIRQAHVVGGSYSGSVAQYLASRHPDCVASLLLSNTAAPGDAPPWRWRLAAAALAPLPEAWLHSLMRAGIGYFLPARSSSQAFWRTYFAETLPRWSKQALRARLRLMAEMETAANVHRLHRSPFGGPVLVVAAAEDRLVSERQRMGLQTLYPQAQTAAFIAKGHATSLDEATTHIQLYREFLCRHAPDQG